MEHTLRDRILQECLEARPRCMNDPCEDPLCGTHRRDQLAALLTHAPPPAPAVPDTAGLAARIDHTVLRPDATERDIDAAAHEAVQFRFAGLCVNPCYVRRAADALAGSPVVVCTVVGFPLGATTSHTKVRETEDVLSLGAREIDMVLHVGLLRSGRFRAVADDIAAVARSVHTAQGLCKVILETGLLTDREKIAASLLARDAGADFVKTSTGFSSGGATVEDVSLLHSLIGGQLGIKASGGIRSRQSAHAMIAAGATRLGTSSSVALVTGPGQ